ETLDELGMSCVALEDYPNATFSGFVKRLRPKQTNITNEKYMGFYLRSKFFRKIMTNNAIMTLRASLNEDIFSYLKLYLPDYQTQSEIGEFLFLINSKIELNNTINAEIEKLIKTIYDYWFVQFDFPTEKGKPFKKDGGKMIWNEQLKREIPVGWDTCLVGNLLNTEKTAKKIPASEICDVGNIPVVDQSTEFIAGFTNDESARIKCDEPRIVFGDHTRVVKLINFDFARGADGTQILLSKERRMPQHVFYLSLLKIDLSNYGYARHFKFLKETRIVIPDAITATLFETLAKDYYERIANNILENQKLEELRDWLLPLLMNGQVSV
ncbi:MAG: restriction endonuclease subunit S, partial [Bdellovibrionaceae bacterium]|nr:restriction endonuclease subunit S [Pseudobdellovibrionaceae bacterium]